MHLNQLENLLELAEETIQMFEFGIDEMNIRQIDLDICRTMPNHQMFNEKANGVSWWIANGNC